LKELFHFSLHVGGLIACVLLASCNRSSSSRPLNEGQVTTAPLEIVDSFEALVDEYEDPGRGDWQNPQLVMSTLGDLNGKIVADIGAGTGYFTFRLARYAQRVIAIDIDERFLQYIRERKQEMGNGSIIEKIETRLTTEDSPGLARQEADVVLLVNTWSFISGRETYLAKVKEGMKPGGRLVIVDFKEGESPVGPPPAMRLKAETVKAELEKGGFREVHVDTQSLAYQYMVVGTL
jgi:SAM-dependent methyltransferase